LKIRLLTITQTIMVVVSSSAFLFVTKVKESISYSESMPRRANESAWQGEKGA